MSSNNHTLNESSHIAEELLQRGPSDIERKCLVIHEILSEGRFPLPRLLEMYEVSQLDYFKFASHYIQSTLSSLIGINPDRDMTSTVWILWELQRNLLKGVDNNFVEIDRHFEKLSKDPKILAK